MIKGSFVAKRIPLLLLLSLAISYVSMSQKLKYGEWYASTKDSIELYVREYAGSARQEPVVVLHGGFGANHDYMLDAMSGLENNFHFYFYDQRGSLLSAAPVAKLTFDQNVEDLKELIDATGRRPVKLLCHSMGTYVAMEFLRRYPHYVSSLVLVSAIPPVATKYEDVFSSKVDSVAKKIIERKEYLELIRPYEARTTLTHKERTEHWRIQFANYNIYNLSQWRLVKGGKAYYKKDAAALGKTATWNFDYRGRLNAHGKVTFIQGDKDFLNYDVEPLKTMLSGYNNITLSVIHDAGHLVWIDQPEKFKTELIKALSR